MDELDYNRDELKKITFPRSLNYNLKAPRSKYFQIYPKRAIQNYLPAVLNYYQKDTPPKFLKIGCGTGAMAFAYNLYFSEEKLNENQFVGIDINKSSIDFLSKNYSNSFLFHFHETPQDRNYVDKNNFAKSPTTLAISDGSECAYNIGFNFDCDLQWSSSVFTHLTPKACEKAINFISHNSKKGCFFFNTFLIVDNQSMSSMRMGYSDRELKYDFGDFLTYDKENPLVCSAYKLDFILELYKNAGMEIIDIQKGAWRGEGISNDFQHQQDVIISRKL